MQGKRIPDDIRAAIIAQLIDGHAVTRVAENFKIPKQTISRLKKEIPAEELRQIEVRKGVRIAELISRNLELSFEAMNNIANQTKNAKWLSEQNAHDLATLFGVTADKVFRVLEAIENAHDRAESEWPEQVV